MSAHRAVHPVHDAANSNDAVARRPTVIFLAQNLAQMPPQRAIASGARVSSGVDRIVSAFAGLASRIANCMSAWHTRARARHALAMLDERQRRDIGISGVDVWREVNKPFWRE